MTYILTDVTNLYAPRVLATAVTLEEAIELVGIAYIEEDPDHEGFFDGIDLDGYQFTIETVENAQ